LPRKKPTTRDSGRAIGYIRVSTEQQVESGLGLESQRKRVKDYCKFKKLKLAEVVEDHAISARDPLAGREAGHQLLALLDDTSYGHVVGLRLDRIFRDTVDCLSVVSSWDAQGVTLHLVDLGGQAFDTKSATGRFFLTVLAAIAEWEALTISERTIAALERKRDRGDDLGGAPYGMEWSELSDGTRGERLVSCEAEQQVIDEILKLHRMRVSIRKIANRLNEDAVPPRGARWHHNTVARILRRSKGAG
jgi:DNA invertase Pin-like site-specific DNA recombinase